MKSILNIAVYSALSLSLGSFAQAAQLQASQATKHTSEFSENHKTASYHGEVVLKVRTSSESKPIYLAVKVDAAPRVFNDTKNITYIATATEVDGGQPKLTPGTLTTGTTFQVQAVSMANGQVALYYQYQNSKLLSLQTQSEGNLKIQLPNISQFAFSQTVPMRPAQQINQTFSGDGVNKNETVQVSAEMIRG